MNPRMEVRFALVCLCLAFIPVMYAEVLYSGSRLAPSSISLRNFFTVSFAVLGFVVAIVCVTLLICRRSWIWTIPLGVSAAGFLLQIIKF